MFTVRGGASPRYVEGRRAAFVLGFPPLPPKLAPFMGLEFFLENLGPTVFSWVAGELIS